jgi:hypothetical protein
LLGTRRVALVQRVGVGKQREQVDHVVFGLVVDRHVLMRERVVQRVAEEFPETGNRLDGHRIPRSIDLTNLSASHL